MKKLLTVLLIVVIGAAAVIGLTACNNKSDFDNIKNNGFFRVGFTYYEPMNYVSEDTLVGFDTEFAQAVAAKLGLEVKFQEIKWTQKYSELNSGAIDCIWNGFTANCADDDGIQRADKVALSYYYMDNAQCVVTKSSRVSEFTSAESLRGKSAAVENGSAGATYATSVGATLINKSTQQDTLSEVKAGAVDFIVIDKLMAEKIIGKGDFSDLSIVEAIVIESEKYAIGFRKGSDFADKVNEAIKELAADGTLAAIAEKYNLSNVLITDYAD